MNVVARKRTTGFSLIELVIVVVIIGIIGAIAIPRLSRGSAGASENALRGNLAVLRSAIELYAAEHDSKFPTAAAIATQLTQYSDIDGNTSATKTGAFIYGPYIQAIPPLPVGAKRGKTGVAAADGAEIGWIYDQDTGKISANTTAETDTRGVAFNTY